MIKVIEKALNILELLAGEQDREISLGEIARDDVDKLGKSLNETIRLTGTSHPSGQHDSPRQNTLLLTTFGYLLRVY